MEESLDSIRCIDSSLLLPDHAAKVLGSVAILCPSLTLYTVHEAAH